MTDKTIPTIAITGAGGFLGSNLIRHFSRKGWHIVALVRRPESYHSDNPLLRYAAYDLNQPVKASLLKGVDYLVHAAYVKQEGGQTNAMDINVRGAEQLAAAARTAGVRRTVFMSSMSAHDKATSTYGLQKLAIEKVFHQPNELSLRSGLIIGNGGLVKQMADFMRTKHAVPLIGGGRQPLQTIGVYDLARVIEAALLHPELSGRLTVATPTVYPYKQFYRLLGQRLGVRFMYVPVPYIALSTVFWIVESLRLPLSVNRDNLIGLKNLRSAKTAADLERLGVALDDLPTALSMTPLD